MPRWIGCSLSWLLLSGSMALAQEAAVGESYSTQIKPLLAKHCAKCHGSQKQQSGLRIDSAKGIHEGGDSGPAIVAGDSAKSILVHAITGAEGISKMPPEGPSLSADEIALIRKWIDEGAKSPPNEIADAAASRQSDHWSFQPIQRHVPPDVTLRGAVRSPLDSFVVARLERERIAPSPEADRATLIRRATLDLLGVPPTPDELHDFLADPAPDAFERLVDRLLASPHFGERWGRDWLDAARYADSNGYTRDMPRTIWSYRDWVVDAFNRNLPFDEFVIEQLAGDMLPNARLDQIVATGFHRNTLINEEGGTDPEQFRIEAVVDRVNTTGTVFLGLTVGCCQCHDHKYDPISQREYYQFFAYFNNAAFTGGDPSAPRIDVPSPEQFERGEPERQKTIRAEIAKLDAEVKASAEAILADQYEWEKPLTDDDKKKLPFNVKNAVDLPPRDRSATHKRDLDAYFRTQPVAREKYPQLDQIARLRDAEPKFPSTMIMQELSKPRETQIHLRGDFLRKGAKVEPAVPAVLGKVDGRGLRVEGQNEEPPVVRDDSVVRGSPDPAQPPTEGLPSSSSPSTLNRQPSTTSTRLDLAHWLVSSDNPLTARVTANRIWQKYLGRGLVETENDFGTQGTPPSHPELLDLLASEFRDDWDTKRFHRNLVTSATYRQASRHRAELAEVDPVNKLLARQSRLRLDAEIIRDAALEASGLLTEELGGPPVYPPQPDGVFDFTQDKKPWKTATGSDRHRKAMYTQLWRSSLYPAMTVFDFPDANVTCTRRVRSNTPLQSLTLANDLTFVEFSRGLASRLLAASMSDDSQRITLACELSLSRQPSSSELARLRSYLDEQRARFTSDTKSA
ncbi:MAG: PSD1 and planctomycete cytochrome C domain-containing protein, partial [Planctomycetota bacterium]